MKLQIDLSGLFAFLNSNFFIGFVTLLTGFIAWRIYLGQKADKKANASRVILSQIRNAETKLKQIKKKVTGQELGDYPILLTANYWEEYSYLFARDFDQDALDEVGNFFDACALIDEYSRKDNEFFWITSEERAKVIQQQLPQLVIAAYDSENNKIDQQKLDQLKQTFLDTVSNETYAYSPSKTINNIKLLIEGINKISTTPIGDKFKQIGKVK